MDTGDVIDGKNELLRLMGKGGMGKGSGKGSGKEL